VSKQKGRRRESAYQLTEKGVANLEYENGYIVPTASTVPVLMKVQSVLGGSFNDVINALYAGLDGWLRCVPTDDGVTFLKWKFTSGRWAGHYVMYRQEGENHLQAFGGLLMKVEAVRMGVARPSVDKFYGSS
jgi:hypothetical protein